MARPRKAESARLVPVSTSLTPERYAVYVKLAAARDMPLAQFLRQVLERPFRNLIISETSSQC